MYENRIINPAFFRAFSHPKWNHSRKRRLKSKPDKIFLKENGGGFRKSYYL